MKVDEAAAADIIRRLRRAEGQIRGVIGMIEAGRECSEIVTQLAAVSRAIDRAGFRVISSGLEQCMNSNVDDGTRKADLEEMERVFLSLA